METYNKNMSEQRKYNHEREESAGCDSEAENQQEKDIKIYLSHDGLFGFAFDKKNVVESFVKEYLPEEITKDLDFLTLTPDKDTFIDQKLSRCYSDVLYHIQFRNNPAYLYFLFEHKSWEPAFPGLQLLKNMINIWEKHIEHHKGTGIKTLPPIIPMLIYHGEHPWKVDTNFVSRFDIPGTLRKYIPDFSFELSDVSHMLAEEIKGDLELRVIFTALRNIFQPDIMSRLKDIFQLFREFPDKIKFNEYLELLLIYLGSNIKDVEPEQLRDAVNEALVEGGAMMSTVFEQIMERGKEIGVKEGEERGEEKNKLRVALNCLKKGMDIQTIAEITDLPVERVEQLITSVQNENNAHQ